MGENRDRIAIGITGGSGSGKTAFVRQLMDSLPEGAVALLCQDNYYHPIEEQVKDEQGYINFDLPSSIDMEQFVKDLRQLMAGYPVERAEYTFNNDYQEDQCLRTDPAPVILVEGLFIFHVEALLQLFDLRVFIHTKENLKVIRRIRRDQLERNYPLEEVLHRYERHVTPTFEQFIEPYQEQADLVINNNRSFDRGLKVLRGYILHRLAQKI